MKRTPAMKLNRCYFGRQHIDGPTSRKRYYDKNDYVPLTERDDWDGKVEVLKTSFCGRLR